MDFYNPHDQILLDASSKRSKSKLFNQCRWQDCLPPLFLLVFFSIQFPILDYRPYLAVNPQVDLLRRWPIIRPEFEFLQYLGIIKATYDPRILRYIKMEDRQFVEVGKSISIDLNELNHNQRAFTVVGSIKRIHYDSRGGVKLLLGFRVNLLNRKNLHYEDIVCQLFNLKVRVRSIRDQTTKECALISLTSHFKNLFHDSTVKGNQSSEVQAINLESLSVLQLSHKEAITLGENTYNALIFKYIHVRCQNAKYPVFWVQGNKNMKQRVNIYNLFYVHANFQVLKGLLGFVKSEQVQRRLILEASDEIIRILDEIVLLKGGSDLHSGANLYLKLFYDQYKYLSMIRKQQELEPAANRKIGGFNSGDLDRCLELIGKGQLNEAINYLDKSPIVLEFATHKEAVKMILFQLNNLHKDYIVGKISTEQRLYAENKIASAIIELISIINEEPR